MKSEQPKQHPMERRTTNILVLVLAFALIALYFTIAPAKAATTNGKARITKVRNPVAMIGSTDDNRYPIYDLQGDVDDLNYKSSQGIVYNPDDLPTRVGFLRPEDVNHGVYTCSFTCKDKKGHTVGLNPSIAKLYGIKLAGGK